MQTARAELHALTGLRAFAAAWVVFHHYHSAAAALVPALAPLRPFARAGFVGVELFFVLSGFIISLTYAKKFQSFDRYQYAEFLWRRLARIYPAYLVTLLGLVLIVAVANWLGVTFDSGVNYSISALVASVFMIQAWGDGDPAYWNTVAWSVSAEWLAYLAFPLVALLLARVKSAHAAVGVGYVVLTTCLALVATRALGTVFGGIDFVSVLRIVGCFLAGAMTYWLYQHEVGRGWRWSLLTPLLGAAVLVSATAITALGGNAIWSALLMPPLILGLAYEGNALSRAFSSRFMGYWGRVSYSLYLTHFILLAVLAEFLGPARFADAAFPIRLGIVVLYFVAAGLAGMAVYHLVEEPARQAMQQLRSRRKQIAVPST